MAATPQRIGAVAYQTESSVAEATRTVNVLLQVRSDSIDVSGLEQDVLESGGVHQYYSDRSPGIPGPKSGTFSFTIDLPGHGGTAASALTATQEATLLGLALGNGVHATNVGGTITSTWADGNSGGVSSATIAAGSLMRWGSLADGKADGQFAAVTTFSAGTATLLTDVAAAPATSDVVYAALQVYPPTATTPYTPSTLRFHLASGARQFWAIGCVCTSLEFTGLFGGERPQVTMTWACLDWEDDASETFPNVAQTAAPKYPVPSGPGGSLFFQARGTATRATVTPRSLSIRIEQDMVAQPGVGGLGTYQAMTAWRRTDTRAFLTFALDAEAAGTNTYPDIFRTDPDTITYRHALYTQSVGDGNSVGWYFNKLMPVGPVPKQEYLNGLASESMTWQALPDTSASTEIERALVIIAFA